MSHFRYQDGALHCEGVPASRLAEQYGTPCYVYSRAAFEQRYDAVATAFAEFRPLVCYSIKACSNLSLLALLAQRGSGFDVVSGGELYRALMAGAEPDKIVYAGVGKTHDEIAYALRAGIALFNVESGAELDNIARIAQRDGLRCDVALRINPDIDAGTHAKTTTGKKENKFGIRPDAALEIMERALAWPQVRVRGLHVHLGSPIYETTPYVKALERLLDFLAECRHRGAPIDTLNMGGGFCVSYTGKSVTTFDQYAVATAPLLRRLGCRLILEPGRSISASSAVLLTRVVYTKTNDSGRRFVICDAAMNDLVRPTLYEAFHRVWPARSSALPPVLTPEDSSVPGVETQIVDVVGPVCESGDYLARARPLPPLEAGDLLAVFEAGAYGFSMGSNYNSRPRPCEVLVEGESARLIRRRERCEDMVAEELDHLKLARPQPADADRAAPCAAGPQDPRAVRRAS